ncbi:hypothetical protein LBMAG42_18760 [Deltaproteobacteria bacterium]|nr:hypothetical protein LBMAG42_18760 [Deltaproteobacteria bacterium]
MALISELHGCPLIERIGEGGIADVFRSEYEGREVALKVLRDTDRASMRRRFLREGRLLQRLDHPGLVRCLAAFDGESPALVLDLLVGLPLDERIARQPLDGDEAMHLAGTVLRVLQYLHDHGIVHRDVKASNIYCASDNRIILMDLGLAADPIDPITTTLGDVLGTYAYMAPEQIAGADSDHRCDLYSLGVTLYEAVCGTRPYAARGAAGWLAAHRSGAAIPLVEVASGIPVRLAGLVDRLMARDPAARPATAAVALAMLTGTAGMRRDLHRPELIGREGARGAIEAVVDSGGWLVITGPLGSGFGPVARMARTVAAGARMEVIGMRGRTRLTGDDVVRQIGHELTRFGLPIAEDTSHLIRLLADLAAEGGVMLLVEDVDALGAAARSVLEAVSRAPGLTVLHVGADLPETPGSRHVVLRPLTVGEIRALLQSMLDSASVPVGLEVALRASSGGLAAHAVTLVREQVAVGTLWCEGLSEGGQPAWRWDVSAGLIPGEGSRRLLERLIDRLRPEARLALELLVVADDAIPLDLLLRLLGGDRSGFELTPLLRQGLVATWNEAGEEWIAVSRAAIERVLRDSIPMDRRRNLHLSLADGLGDRAGGEWEQRFAVFHRALGTRTPAALAQLVELGESLAHAGRPMTALHLLDQMEMLADTPAVFLARRAIARAVALRTAGRLSESRDALAAAAPLLPEVAEAEWIGRIEALELELTVAMGAQPSETLVERVGSRMEDGRAEVLLALGELAAIRGQLATADALLAAAVAAASGPTDRIATRARIGQAMVRMYGGETAEAERRLFGLVRELRGRDRRSLLADAYLALARAQRLRGQFSRAMSSVDLASEAQGRRDVRAHGAYVNVLRAWILLGAGDLAGSEAALEREAGSAGSGLPYEVRSLYFEVLAEARRQRGDAPASLAAHLAGLDAARAADDPIRAYYHDGMAGLLTANARLVSEAVSRLGQLGAHRHLAMLYLLGALVGRDPDVLVAAEAEARLSEDPALQLEVLFAVRAAPRRAEARSLARGLLEAAVGNLQESMLRLPAVRWAMEEPGRPLRDKSP